MGSLWCKGYDYTVRHTHILETKREKGKELKREREGE